VERRPGHPEISRDLCHRLAVVGEPDRVADLAVSDLRQP
jgi:hypothetical protein